MSYFDTCIHTTAERKNVPISKNTFTQRCLVKGVMDWSRLGFISEFIHLSKI